MFFTVSKALWLVAEPVTFAILAGILGILLGATRFARVGRVVDTDPEWINRPRSWA
jgi:hypothetical protein